MINLLKKPYKKKGSKFQPFKKFFGRRKKREATPDRETTKLKASSSFGNVCNGALSSDEETNNGLRSPSYSMGTRAFSHESVFMPDGRAESEESIQAMSQDNLVGKVKTLQQQLAKNIKFGQPSQMTVPVKAPGEVTASLEADGLLNNPMETVMPPDVVLPENHPKSAVMPDSLSPTSLGETSRDRDEKVTPVKVSSRPKRHHSPSGTIETVNLDAIPLATVCLDNSAAKHKLSVRPKNQRVSKKHRLSKEVQSVIEIDFEQDILESQGSEDKMTKDDGYYRPGKLIQHGEVQEQKTEGKRKQNHWETAGKKEEMAEAKFTSPVEHKRFQEFEGVQVEQVGRKPILQEEQLYQTEEKKDQEHQAKGLKEQEKQGRKGEGLEKLQAEIPKKSQDLEEQKQRYREQAQHEREAQRQQEERKPHEVDTQWQKEKKKKQQELEAQRQQGEAKRQGELEVQRQQQEEEQRQCELEVQRQYQEETRKQHDLEIQRQRETEQKRQHELEVQRQQEEEKRQRELELQRQREEEQKRQRELELQRQREEEQKRQHELELQRQWEEEQKRQRELELQRQREEEQKRQRELELQRQLEEEQQKRQRELELQRQREEEQKRQRELELQRQREEEQKRQRELELQRQLEEEQKRQRELELQRQWEEEQKRRRELELQRQREEEQKRQRELELQRQWEEEQKRRRELELQRQREEEQKRQRELELQRQWEEEQKRRRELELQRQREEEQKRQRELELQRQWEEEQKRQRELELQRQREEEQKRHRELELQRQLEEEQQKRQREVELQRQREEQQKRQCELELQRQREEEQKREHELELQRQLEEEQKRQCELEVQRQHHEEAKRQRELDRQRQREEEQKRHRELELQRQLEEEQQKRQREVELQRQREEQQKRQCELELQRQREEEQKREHELELQRQLEEEQKRQCELEVQRQHHEEAKRQRELDRQRQREEEQKRQRELELQRQREEEAKRQSELDRQKQRQEEQKRHEQEAQRPQEEKKRQYEQEEQRHKDCMMQKQQNIRDAKEEKRHQETEQNDSFIQQGWKDKKKEPEKQKTREEEISHPYLGKQVSKELKTGQSEESENQQLLQEQNRELGQRKKEQEESSKKLDDRNKLQEKGTAMKVKGQEEQQRNLNEFGAKEQKLAKSVGSAEHRKVAPAETGHLWAGKEVQREEFIQRTEDLQLERQKILCLEDQQSLEKPKEEKESNQLHMSKHPDDECLQTVEKELQAKEEAGQQQRTQPGKEQMEEGSLRIHHLVNAEVEKQERVLGEELRWQEVDAGQTTSRGFTFQVSSGEKEIIFPKVNLSPVTPVQEAPLPSATKEFKDPKSSRGSSNLPTSLCVPHTAILVTGAQLCSTAVNLNQIKDTACKSLLGLTEEKKGMDAPQPESIQKPVDGRPNSTKVKHVQDSVDNQAILDEWASIRSKILKGAENDKFNEQDNGSLNRHSDDWTAKGRSAFRGNLRKTLSANAKFSITPAWHKFSEMSKTNTAAEDKTAPEAENAAVQLSPSTLPSDNEAVQTESPVGTKNVGTSPGKIRGRQEVAGNTEGCKFAKDLPSFLVPSLPYSPNKELSPSETLSTMETQQNVGSKKIDRASPSGEENVGPFGVKLRRTNYSLRFHYDQQAEQKKKKRYSAGDSFDGLPTPLVTPDNEQDAKPLFLKDSKSLSQERKDAKLNSDNSTLTIISRNYTIVAPISCPTGPTSAPGQEKTVSKSPLPPKPALAPKPISQTPPSSPLSKPRRAHVTEPIGKRVSKVEPDTSWRKSEGKGSPHPSQAPSQSKNEEEESREKKSFFPSITMPWREKAEKKPEPLKKERPILQSRHSIDGSKVMEKGETAQPLWITLALQKQKGFREQQATREERRQAREAKQAEKLAKENASVNNQLADNKSNNMSKSNILQKSTVSEEEKKIETATSRFERREQLKKSNTLPSSVTVEITDSLSSSPLAKEVTKRFSTPDANPVSTEPAWLALAKRKAKAWSDCPQIIK